MSLILIVYLQQVNLVFDPFDKFNLLYNMEKLVLTWNNTNQTHLMPERLNDDTICTSFFNRVCNNRYRCRYPSLERIKIRFDCYYLYGLLEEAARICNCLFISRNVIKNQSNIRWIEFEWNLYRWWDDPRDQLESIQTGIDTILPRFNLKSYKEN